jgi:hypothetical protein
VAHGVKNFIVTLGEESSYAGWQDWVKVQILGYQFDDGIKMWEEGGFFLLDAAMQSLIVEIELFPFTHGLCLCHVHSLRYCNYLQQGMQKCIILSNHPLLFLWRRKRCAFQMVEK